MSTEHKPIPMVVQQHENMLDDQSKVIYQEVVDGGVCGFAWMKIHYDKPSNRKFINIMKKLFKDKKTELNIQKSYEGGFSIWCPLKTQSMSTKETYCRVFCEAMMVAFPEIEMYIESRMD